MEYRGYFENKIGLKKLIVGHDHHFGRNREASIKQVTNMQLYDFEIHEVPLKVKWYCVSSAKIRNALEIGNVELIIIY